MNILPVNDCGLQKLQYIQKTHHINVNRINATCIIATFALITTITTHAQPNDLQKKHLSAESYRE